MPVYWYYADIVIAFGLAQSDPIKRLLLYHIQFCFLKWMKVRRFLSFQNVLVDCISASQHLIANLFA